jgi:DNA-binding CsgD family transcriptional regulator
MTLELDVALLAQLEGAAHARHQPPEALAGELLALALRRETQRARAEASLANLTPRQREVAWLAARGYTNLRIAETLVVSPETVKTHMRHVLEKLGLRAKAQLQMLLSASPSGSGVFAPDRALSPAQSNGD